MAVEPFWHPDPLLGITAHNFSPQLRPSCDFTPDINSLDEVSAVQALFLYRAFRTFNLDRVRRSHDYLIAGHPVPHGQVCDPPPAEGQGVRARRETLQGKLPILIREHLQSGLLL